MEKESPKFEKRTFIQFAVYPNEIQLFDPEKEEIYQQILLKNGVFYEHGRTVSAFDNRLFAIGGYDENTKSFKSDFREISLERTEFKDKKCMKIARECFGVACSTTEIFVIGGSNAKTIGECESQSIIEEKWNDFTNLPYPLDGVAATILQKLLFAIGGDDGQNWVNKIHKISLENRFAWENIQLKGDVLSNMHGSIAFPITETMILICGGYGETGKIKKCFIFDKQKNEICETQGLPSEAQFSFTPIPTDQKEKVFVFDYNNNKKLFIFSKDKSEWRVKEWIEILGKNKF